MNIGVIGAGWWGKNIINTLEINEEVGRVYYTDIDPATQIKFQSNRKAIYLPDAEAILASSDVSSVCVATPPATHYELTRQAFQAGKHVLVEKPPALTSRHVNELGILAEAKGLVYMMDALFLFLDPVRKVKEIIDSGILKNIHYVEIYRIGDELRREGAGIQRIRKTMFDNNTDVVEDLFFHDAGILLNLFHDLELKSVSKSYLYNKTLCDTARIEFDTEYFPVTLTLSWSLIGRRRGISVYDRDYILEYDGLRQENQVSLHYLPENRAETYSFNFIPPLNPMLEYFIHTILTKSVNSLDYNFMYSILKLWENINNAK